MFFQEIETERLVLKNISFDDREFMLKEFSDDAVNRYLFDIEPLSTLEGADEIINFYLQPEPRTQHRWIIVLKNDDTKIGTCGFHCWYREQNCVDIGYDLQEAFWGQGIMSEALKAILSFSFKNMKVSQVNAHIYVENDRSIHLVQRLGFKFNGSTEICSFRGIEYLHNIYTLTISTIK